MKCVLLLVNFYFLASKSMLKFKVDEGVQVGTEIADLTSDFKNLGITTEFVSVLNQRDFKVSHFGIKFDSGILRLITLKNIDREVICEYEKNKINSDGCKIDIQIILGGSLTIHEIQIEVIDTNDNIPYWNSDSINVEFMDGDLPGIRKTIPTAIDLDSSVFSTIFYNLSDPTRFFKLVETADNLYIQNSLMLDSETTSKFTLHLYASNPGIDRSSSLLIQVTIVDINDNPPLFSKLLFSRNEPIPEDIPINSVVLVLSATDRDSGLNGEFSFRIDSNKINNKAIEYFIMKSVTGEIVVRKPLDYDRGMRNFFFKVIVEDHAFLPYSLSSEAFVNLTVGDVNDEIPQIDFYAIQNNKISNQFAVLENTPKNTLVGFIMTNDVDFNENDEVFCRSLNSFFVLNSMSTREQFQIYTTVIFDREQQDKHFVSIECTDQAYHMNYINKTLLILDDNDNDPYFFPDSLNFYLYENMPSGAILTGKLRSFDKDIDNNSQVHYYLHEASNKDFKINTHEGTLISLRSFDREERSSLNLTVYVEDEGNVKRSSKGFIHIVILDMDDNPIVFTKDKFVFHISENSVINTVVGSVQAVDLDENTIVYSILNPKNDYIFLIDKFSGVLTTNSYLDREKVDRYFIKVVAFDSNIPIEEAMSKNNKSIALVEIKIDDENDNFPVIIFPNFTHNRLNASLFQPPEKSIFQIYSTDSDSGENQTLIYGMENEDSHKIFKIHRTSGLVFLKTGNSNLDVEYFSTHVIKLKVCDSGNQPKCTVFHPLYVNLTSDYPINTHVLENTKKEKKIFTAFWILTSIITVSLLTAFITGSILLYLKIRSNQAKIIVNMFEDHRNIKPNCRRKKFQNSYSISNFAKIKMNEINQAQDNSIEIFSTDNIHFKSSFV